jgi:hypothetical protein
MLATTHVTLPRSVASRAWDDNPRDVYVILSDTREMAVNVTGSSRSIRRVTPGPRRRGRFVLRLRPSRERTAKRGDCRLLPVRRVRENETPACLLENMLYYRWIFSFV